MQEDEHNTRDAEPDREISARAGGGKVAGRTAGAEGEEWRRAQASGSAGHYTRMLGAVMRNTREERRTRTVAVRQP